MSYIYATIPAYIYDPAIFAVLVILHKYKIEPLLAKAIVVATYFIPLIDPNELSMAPFVVKLLIVMLLS